MGKVWKNPARITKPFVTMVSSPKRQPKLCPKYCHRRLVR
jgi:hypothetical protein